MVRIWFWMLILALNFQYALTSHERCCRGFLRGPLTLVQHKAAVHLEGYVWLMADQHPEKLRTIDWPTELKNKRVSYEGDEITLTAKLSLDQVCNGLPPEGAAASLDAVHHARGEVREILLDPGRILKPASQWPSRPKRSRIWAHPGEWRKVGSDCWHRGMMRVIAYNDIFRLNGTPVFIGAFGEVKPKLHPSL